MKKKKVMKQWKQRAFPRPGLPWDLVRPHSETDWRHRCAAGCTKNRTTVPTGSWCTWKTGGPSDTQLPTSHFIPAPSNCNPGGRP